MTEYLDELNESGEKTGTVKARAEMHRLGIWHRTAHVWILNSKGELLMQRRSSQTETDPNVWWMGSFAGHIRVGQTSLEAAVAEATEELGIILKPTEIEFLFTVPDNRDINNGLYHIRHIVDSYLVQRDLDLQSVTLQAEEVAAAKWILFSELEQLIASRNPDFLIEAAEYERLFPLLHERFDL